MGMNFRRSRKIAPGIRLNFSNRGLGLSVGPKHAKISISPTKRITANIGIPGTGIRFTERLDTSKTTPPVQSGGTYTEQQSPQLASDLSQQPTAKMLSVVPKFSLLCLIFSAFLLVQIWHSPTQSAQDLKLKIGLALASLFLAVFALMVRGQRIKKMNQ